jgi:S-adenosylmethionine hydrolase
MQIVSLTSDYGTRDYYLAELKAAILSTGNHLQVVDVSNDVDRFDIVQASFFIKNVIPSFPEGTIHVVAVHCHYTSHPELIGFERNGHYFIGPNNGILSLVFDDLHENEVVTIPSPGEKTLSLNALIAHATGYISHQLPLTEIGPSVSQLTRKLVIQPVVTSSQIRATIMHIDHFENVIVNLKKDVFEKTRNGRNFEIYYKPNEPITTLSINYGDVSVGEALAFFNTSGYLEIALNMDKASSMLNLHKNETIQINFK